MVKLAQREAVTKFIVNVSPQGSKSLRSQDGSHTGLRWPLSSGVTDPEASQTLMLWAHSRSFLVPLESQLDLPASVTRHYYVF